MENRYQIVEHLRSTLETRSDIYAFWVEDSAPRGHADEFYDIDLWLSTDDDKIFAIHDVRTGEVESVSPQLGEWVESL